MPAVVSPLSRHPADRERWAAELLDRMTPIMSLLGILFALVVLSEQLARPGSAVEMAMTVLGWLLWLAFAAEFATRLVVAPDTGRFLRRNWWQLVFLALPFLRLLRLVRALRVLRSGRVLSGAVRGSRSAQYVLGSRLAGLVSVVAIVVLGAGQLLYQFSDYEHFAAALHAAALGAITGEPLAKPDGFAQTLELFLAAFSVVVFGALAGLLGSFFTEKRGEQMRAESLQEAGTTAAGFAPDHCQRSAEESPPPVVARSLDRSSKDPASAGVAGRGAGTAWR